MNYKKIEELAQEAGFHHTAPLDVSTIELKPEVRDMCAQCGQYNRRWSCPPGCGTLEEGRALIGKYTQGILVQTVGELEDEFDGEGMMEAQMAQNRNLSALIDLLRPLYPDMLPIGTGCCMRCKTCTYPDEPCRFPEEKISSMEAYGMLVLEVCKKNNLTYYYGPSTIAYTACILFA